MANTARTNEIDEVMSSVRRLVSKVDLDIHHPVLPEDDPVVADELPERFVLTPSLRVDHAPISDDEQHRSLSDEVLDSTALPAHDTGSDEEEPESETTEDDVSIQVETALDVDLPENPTEPDTARVAVVSQIDDALVTNTEEPTERVDLEKTLAALEAAVTPETVGWEPQDTDNLVAVALASVTAKSSAFTDVDNGASSIAHIASVLPEPNQTDASAPLDEDEGGDEDDDLSVFSEEDIKVDEAVLREMVVDIIREELSGVLGERITRNVRKLVRREINRVLTTHGID